MPQETKDLVDKLEKEIEKLEKENSKATTKNLHSATTALGRAEKTLAETLEARKAHRARWTQHIAEAVKTWQTQLSEYKQQQSTFNTIAMKARADIDHARSALQMLSTKAAPATLAAMPPLASMSGETEESSKDADKDAEVLQHQLQEVLQECAASLQTDLTMPLPPQDVMDLEEEDSEKGQKKRLRSMEPFGGGGGAASTPLADKLS